MNRLISPWVLFTNILIVSLNAHSQKALPTDSLLSLLETNPADSDKIDLYISLYQVFVSQDTAKSLDFIQQAINLSEKTKDKKRLANSYLKLAYYHDRKGDLSKARNALDHIEKELQNFHDIKIKAAYYMQSGIIFYFEGVYDKAVNDFWEALTRYEKIGDSVTVASCNLLIGESNRKLGNMDRSLAYFEKAMEIYKSHGDEKGLAMAMGNIGIIYKAKGNYPRALEYYQESLKFNQKNGLHEEALIDLGNIGNLYADLGNYQTASKFHEQSLEMAEAIGSKYDILSAKLNLANVRFKSGNKKTALIELEQVLDASTKLGYKDLIMDSYMALSNIYERTSNYKTALDNLKIYHSWKDSLLSERHLSQVKELEVKYETEKKEKQIVALANEKEIQEHETMRQSFLKVLFMCGSAALVILFLLVFFLLRQRLRNQKILAVKNEEIKEGQFRQQLSELELKALRAQINPHFIFNCMNSINQMILDGENQNASKYLSKFGKLIRLILENSEETEVALEDELAMLEMYIQLELLRFGGAIEYSITVEEDVDAENTYLPAMVLQPLVENALWHGLMPKKDTAVGRIAITIKQKPDSLLCVIEDNGIGREKALKLQQKTVYKSNSLGLKITEERLRLLSREMKRQWIRFVDLKDPIGFAIGTRVEVSIPIS